MKSSKKTCKRKETSQTEVMKFHREIMQQNGPNYCVLHLKNFIKQTNGNILLRGFWLLYKVEKENNNNLVKGIGNLFSIKKILLDVFGKKLFGKQARELSL